MASSIDRWTSSRAITATLLSCWIQVRLVSYSPFSPSPIVIPNHSSLDAPRRLSIPRSSVQTVPPLQWLAARGSFRTVFGGGGANDGTSPYTGSAGEGHPAMQPFFLSFAAACTAAVVLKQKKSWYGRRRVSSSAASHSGSRPRWRFSRPWVADGRSSDGGSSQQRQSHRVSALAFPACLQAAPETLAMPQPAQAARFPPTDEGGSWEN